ncbi:unnamed protein product, partial [Tilletia controversa]
MPTQRRHHHLPSHALIPTTPFHPTANPAAFRDLLIFEERLKQAAARYTRRKRKYQTLLTFLLAATLTSAYHAAASSPHWTDRALTPPERTYYTHADGAAMLRYYLWVGLFLFFSTTTFLFFASGLYSERIAAGATFVPQANRALGYYN